jgi:hypothetical protein
LQGFWVEEDAKCEFRIKDETGEHVILRCPRLTDIRAGMKEVAGRRWGDLSYLLGVCSRNRKSSGWSDREVETGFENGKVNDPVSLTENSDRSYVSTRRERLGAGEQEFSGFSY